MFHNYCTTATIYICWPIMLTSDKLKCYHTHFVKQHNFDILTSKSKTEHGYRLNHSSPLNVAKLTLPLVTWRLYGPLLTLINKQRIPLFETRFAHSVNYINTYMYTYIPINTTILIIVNDIVTYFLITWPNMWF